MSAQVSAAQYLDHLDALTRPVTPDAVAAFRAQASADDVRDMVTETIAVVWSAVWRSLVTVVVVVVPATFTMVLATLNGTVNSIAIVITVIGCGISGLLIATFGRWQVLAIRRAWKRRGSWAHRLRLTTFAADNELLYSARRSTMPRIGSVVAATRATYWDAFALRLDGRVMFFSNAWSKNSTSQQHAPAGWGVIAIKLDARLPHMYLAPRASGLQRTTPLLNLAGSQRLSLEGDFGRHFTLYAPRDYQRDALYVLTPDLMALLIDELPGSYVETYDDLLVITAPRPMDFEIPATWDRISRVLDTVVRKTVRQTRRYRDDRSPDAGQVAGAGRRLRAGLPIGTAITVAIVIGQVVRIILAAT